MGSEGSGERVGRVAPVIDEKDSDGAPGSKEAKIHVVEWTRGSEKPLVCSWLTPKTSATKYTFDTSECDRIFDFLLQQELIRVPDGHVIPSAEELKERSYCKWHHSYFHNTNHYNVFCR